ncbi:arginase family protein [Anaeromyxobacter oryzisoli]|uniref:arginase family protein n=1 Tax=Anaeromyxobacter oryzisoli TaxID=2925408 RepID=UPI001F560CB4|nr:arginase family protein [Anaeromyxobacter sp. SG63]
MTPVDTLAHLLRPAGGGIYLVSTGRAEQLALQRRLYGASSDAEVQARWRADLAAALDARGVLLGIPSDVGAGLERGASLGPAAIRARLLEDEPAGLARRRGAGLVDLGDVFVVPQLLHDEMLSAAQLAATRAALYPDLPAAEAAALPVSPLSIAERALALVLAENPRAKVFAIGGDHSTAWPVVKALAAVRPGLGIVQVDAHTDLLAERLGVRYCFGTWAYHANELVGRGGRLVQVGTRASARDRSHWESTLGVRQLWAAEVARDPAAALDAILAQVKGAGVSEVYFTNDIDGTDAAFADATGTPEPGGLAPGFVSALVARLGREVGLAGGDVMEVAPHLARSAGGGERTVALAARYLSETIEAALG